MAGALSVHGAGAAGGMSQLPELAAFAKSTRALVLDRLLSTYDVELEKPKPPPEPEPGPEPDPEDEPEEPTKVPNKETDTAVEEKPPAAAEAARVLTAEPDPDAPLDLTGEGFVVGNADRYAGGVTASTGTSKTAVYDRRAKPDGVVGGKGKHKVKRQMKREPPPTEDRSRDARPQSLSWDSCGFPADADMEQIDYARVTLVVTVGTDGRAKSVVVQNDPGYGFGALARRCALRRRYQVGLDRAGNPVTRTTAPFTVTFTR